MKSLLSGECFDQIQQLLNWLKSVGNCLGLPLHDDPNDMIRPFAAALFAPRAPQHPPLTEEDEELVRLAEMTFLEVDAR